jgi:thymidine kinase
MLTEPNHKNPASGWIEVVCGSMFSGKTEELIRRLKRARIANLSVGIFKPSLDVRYDAAKIVSHDENTIESIPLTQASHILNHAKAYEVIGIDEAQFFDEKIVDVCDQLANNGKRVIVAGLDMDYIGEPFGPMPKLLSIANYVTKLHAICMKCGSIASYSYRIIDNTDQVVLGEKDHYEARCRNCFNLQSV